MKPKLSAFLTVLVLAVAAAGSVSCNIFDPFDNPGGDEQLLSAARACFDRGDLDCAREKYGQLSSASDDIKKSELVFLTLHQQGASMTQFIKAVAGGNFGAGITDMANELWNNATQPSAAKRQTLLDAYLSANQVSTSNSGLRGLTRFVAATALLAELISEAAGTDHVLTQADWVTDPSVCKADGTCVTCTGGSSTPSTAGSSTNLDAVTSIDASQFSIQAAISKIDNAMTEMNAGGSLSGGADGFSGATLALAVNTNCFLRGLLNQGIGE